MRKTHLIMCAICIVLCAIMGIQFPTASGFVIDVQAQETINEPEIDAEKIKDVSIKETTEKIISEKITSESAGGKGRTFDLETENFTTNVAKNIALEDEFKEEIPVSKTENKTTTSSSKTKYKRINDGNEITSFDKDASDVTYLGNFKLTAYCSCVSCCGKWGANRKVDSEGYTIVGTASGARAYANHTIAVDPKVIPYGTTVIIERNGKYYEYVAEDCGGAIKNKKIDVYHDKHSEATAFGVKYGNVYIIKK